MTVFSIDIACSSSTHDYAALFASLRQARAQRLLDARWLIDVNQDLDGVTRALLSHCAPGDGLFVTELAPETRWSGTGLGEEAKAWFAARMGEAELAPAAAPAPAAAAEHRLN